ncbi:MAG: beta-lactamase family protein [Polyangiaceae bacterium]|nr:beta-lactamase family protein [Polyangiaceae bacterium]
MGRGRRTQGSWRQRLGRAVVGLSAGALAACGGPSTSPGEPAPAAPPSPLGSGAPVASSTPSAAPEAEAGPPGRLRPIGDPVLEPVVDRLLRAALAAEGPGMALAVVTSRGVRLLKTYGHADIEAGTPVELDTLFDLASLSKPLTALAVLALAERGAVRLADPLARYLPELGRRKTGRPVRLIDLLQMSSALPEYTNAADALGGAAPPTAEAVVRLVRYSPSTREPGTAFDYTNTNYVLLAHVAERATGKPFARVLREDVLPALGMTDARVLDAGPEPAGRAVGYRRDATRFTRSRHDVPTLGDGGVLASLRDLVAWDAALRRIEAGEPGLVGRAALELSESPGRLDSGARFGYGHGWFVSEAGPRRVHCAGTAAGTSAYVVRYLDEGLSVILLSNQGGLDFHVVDTVAELYRAR